MSKKINFLTNDSKIISLIINENDDDNDNNDSCIAYSHFIKELLEFMNEEHEIRVNVPFNYEELYSAFYYENIDNPKIFLVMLFFGTDDFEYLFEDHINEIEGDIIDKINKNADTYKIIFDHLPEFYSNFRRKNYIKWDNSKFIPYELNENSLYDYEPVQANNLIICRNAIIISLPKYKEEYIGLEFDCNKFLNKYVLDYNKLIEECYSNEQQYSIEDNTIIIKINDATKLYLRYENNYLDSDDEEGCAKEDFDPDLTNFIMNFRLSINKNMRIEDYEDRQIMEPDDDNMVELQTGHQYIIWLS